MKKLSKTSVLFLIGACLAGVICLGSFVMVIVSAVLSGRNMSLGIDLNSYNVVKMAVAEDGTRIAGTQDGTLFAFDEDGEILWNVGAVHDRAVYDIATESGKVFAAYADGSVYVFSMEDAAAHAPAPAEDGEEGAQAQPAGSFAEQCKVYRTENSLSGNVSNTQLLVREGGETFYLRGRFNDGGNRYYIYRFDSDEEAELVQRSSGSFRIGGMALSGDDFYYAFRGTVYLEDGVTELFTIDQNIVAVSATETELAVITEGNTLVVYDFASGQTVYDGGIRTALDSNYVFSLGRNFLAKIKNGGVALIGTEERGVTLTMNASDSANFVLWNDDCFMLRDTSDIEHPVVIFYSVPLARSISLFSTLLWVFIALMILSAAVCAVCGAAVVTRLREKMQAATKEFAKAVWRQKTIYLSLLIPFALLITFYFVPIVLGFSLSFLDYIPGEKSVFVGFRFFTAVFSTPGFWEGVGNMAVFLVTDLLKALIPPFIIAELIFTVRFKRFSLWTRILLFLPGILPGVATALVWSQGIFGDSQNSVINAFVGMFVPNFAMNWINNPSNAIRLTSIIAFGFPWVGSYLIFYGALGGINQSIFEAAKLDGCSWIRRVVTIDIPMIFAQFKYVFITSFIASIQNYSTLYILYGAEGTALVKTPALMMYGEIMAGNYGIASVMGIFLFAILIVASIFNFKSQQEQIV